MVGNGRREGMGFFEHPKMVDRYSESMITKGVAQGRHFFDIDLPWNGLSKMRAKQSKENVLFSCGVSSQTVGLRMH